MNVFGKNGRGWRKAKKRGVSPIIATILLVAITVVLAAVLYVLISGLTRGPGNTPLGTAFAWGSQKNVTTPSGGTLPTGCALTAHSCYSIEIASASNLGTSDLNFALRGPTGGAMAFVSGTTVTLVGLGGTSLATYSVATNTWSASVSIVGGDSIVVYTATSGYLLDSLVAVGVGSFSGTVTATAFS